MLSQLRIQEELPYFLDQTEARRAERMINNFFKTNALFRSSIEMKHLGEVFEAVQNTRSTCFTTDVRLIT